MVSETELEGFRKDRYFARSWALLTRDRGWIKPVLVMTVALFVPIVGLFGVVGYALEWARLTAWNINASPKQKGVRVGECIGSGARAFVISLVWGIIAGIIMGILGAIPLIGGLLTFVWSMANILFGVVVLVAALRATIYKRLRAGFRLSAIRHMLSHDTSGILRIFGLGLMGALIMGIVASIITLCALISTIPQLLVTAEYLSSYGAIISSSMQTRIILEMVFSMIGSALPSLVVLGVISSFMYVVMTLLVTTAVGLWMRQFDVPSWGRDEDPLPSPVMDPRDAAPQGGSWQAPYDIPVDPQPRAAHQDAAEKDVAPEPPAPAQDSPVPAEPRPDVPAEDPVETDRQDVPAELPAAKPQDDQPTPFSAEDPSAR
ncbi:DUF4013 domain-containing protein [Thermophilibacter provencensis]|uniref:DUF4013 domain-containing protein n=1 Tax=Thermophilibacter provencensis TaxID=1852386 RepID=A0ABT7V2H9_9ACTN|nr:DUF4013 domain-containing protein [Thermophilibacter provencensis]MDM8270799.1 DUF4013 domain-containing protein [Thermophilibacter provencensis]